MVSAAAVRKTVSVVFCDLAGSTALGEQLDPEPLRELMGAWYDAMRAAVERHGGTVEKFIGDAVMAVFGVPQVHEDDALRAVRAAIEMQAAAAALGAGLRVRVGVNTGEVVTGDATTTLVTGDAVNTAKRLEEAAGDGEILIGAVTRRLVAHAAHLEEAVPVEAKGKRAPVEAWRVVGAVADAEPFARRADTPLVGRDAELSLLQAELDAVAAGGNCRLVTVLGPAGAGKSRLASELAAAVAGRARVVAGRCLPYGDGITFWPLLELLRSLGGEEAVARIVAPEPDAALILERLRSLTGGESRAPEELFWAVRRLLESLAREQPLVVRLEDVHWAEPTLLDLVEYISGWSRGAPILLLCLARPDLLEQRPRWEGALVRLAALSDSEADALVDSLAAGLDLSVALRRRIAAAAQGNPLYLEQLVAMLAESGGEPEELPLPPTTQALIASRLDRLDPHERDVLERASVVGREFRPGAVNALGETPDASLGATLLGLVRRELVEPAASTIPGEDGFRFRHVLIRDAAYASAPKGRRADHHERLVDWLTAAGAGTEELDEILGYHLEQAHHLRRELAPADERTRGLAERAHALLARAGRRADARGDASATRSLLGRALALEIEAPGRLELRRRLAHALWNTGETARAVDEVDAVAAEAAAAGDRSEEWYARLDAAGMRGVDGPHGLLAFLETAARAVEVFSELEDEPGLAQAWRRISLAESVRASYAAAEAAAERALHHARRCDERQDASRAADVLCTALLWGPKPVDDALARCEELLAEAGAANGPLRANVLAALGGLRALRGDVDGGRACCVEAGRIFDELGLRMSAAGLGQVAAQVELRAGEPTAAERHLRDGLDVLRGGASEPLQLGLLAAALVAQGRHDEAAAVANAARELAASEDVLAQVLWRTALARAEASRGATETALALAREAVDLAALTDALTMHADALADLAAVLAAAGRAADADAALRAAAELHERKGAAPRREATGRSRALAEQPPAQ